MSKKKDLLPVDVKTIGLSAEECVVGSGLVRLVREVYADGSPSESKARSAP